MRSPTCALARLLPISPASEDDLHAMRAAAWHKQGVIVVVLDSVSDSWERTFLEGIGTRLYGRRSSVAEGMRDGQ